MAIVKKQSTQKPASTEAFISGAPDASAEVVKKEIKKAGNKAIITLSIDPDLLARVDAWAKAHGMSRAAAIAFAASHTLTG